MDGLGPQRTKLAASDQKITLALHTINMNRITPLLAALLVTCVGPALAQGQPQSGLWRVKLSAGMHLIDAQLARTPEQREIGLMYRAEMPTQEGMLFQFEEPGVQCFWMKNTPSPLTAAFVADDGTIVNLADMQPLSEQSHCAAKPVRYVLEMNQGWFGKRAIQPGFKLLGEPFSRK